LLQQFEAFNNQTAPGGALL